MKKTLTAPTESKKCINLRSIDKGYLIIIAVFLLLTPFVLTPWIHGSDGTGYYSYIRSVVIDHNLDLKNEYEYQKQLYPYIAINTDPGTGRVVNGYTIGTAIMWSPFFIAGHFAAYIANTIGFSVPMDGFSAPYRWFTMFGSAFYGLLGLLLIYRMCRKYFNRTVSLLAVLFVWFGSSLFFYMFLDPSFSHANSMFAVTLFIYIWHETRGKRKMWHWAAMGAAASLMVLVRPQEGLFMALPLVEGLAAYYKSIKSKDFASAKKLLAKHALFIVVFALLLTPQLFVWKQFFGSYFSGPKTHNVEGNLNILMPDNVLLILFHHQSGMFFWTPILFFALLGIYWFYKIDKKTALYFLFAFLLQLYLISCWVNWRMNGFGQRKFIDCTFVFVLGIAALLEFMKKKNLLKYAAVAGIILVTWSMLLLVQFGSRMITMNADLTLGELLRNQIEVPKKLFGILKNFIISRGSFRGE